MYFKDEEVMALDIGDSDDESNDNNDDDDDDDDDNDNESDMDTDDLEDDEVDEVHCTFSVNLLLTLYLSDWCRGVAVTL